MLFLVLKIIHLSSVILFVGSIFFITYIIDVLKHQNPKEEYKLFAPKISTRARKLMFINVPIVLLSGLALLFMYDFANIAVLMWLKVVLALGVIVTFFLSDWIVKKTDHIHWFHHFFHHAVIFVMALVVILSQLM